MGAQRAPACNLYRVQVDSNLLRNGISFLLHQVLPVFERGVRLVRLVEFNLQIMLFLILPRQLLGCLDHVLLHKVIHDLQIVHQFPLISNCCLLL